MRVNWQARLSEAMNEVGDDGAIAYCFPGREEFLELFEGDAYVGDGGKRVMAWTDRRVYFSVADACGGYRWLDSAPRNPPEAGDQPRVGSW